MNMNIYTHRYSITAADIDNNYRMTPNAVLLYYQDCWARYMSCLHLAAFDLVHSNRIWVISEFNAFWNEEEAYWSQDVEVRVWNSELTGLRLYSNFSIQKSDGSTMAHGYGCWTLLDIAQRRPIVLNDISEKLMLSEVEKHSKTIYPLPQEQLKEVNHHVNAINLDFNGHLNNRAYLDIAMQTISNDWVGNRKIQSLSIRWQHETFYGEDLVCRMFQTNQENAYLHVISRADTSVAQIYSTLSERHDSSIIDNEAPRT